METPEKGTCRKKKYQKVSFDLTLSIIDGIANGQTSVNHASKKYNISRSFIDYWIKKSGNLDKKSQDCGQERPDQKTQGAHRGARVHKGVQAGCHRRL